MSEELSAEGLDEVVDPIETEESAEQTEETAESEQQSEPDQYSSEARARKSGWKPLDEYDGDPSKWRSSEEFNVRGEFIDKFRRQDEEAKGFKEQLGNMHQLHEVAMGNQRKELEAKRDDAVATANIDEFNKIQGQIDNMPVMAPVQPVVIQTDEVVDQWNKDNPWIMGNSAKANFVRAQYGSYAQEVDAYGNPKHTQESALNAMKADLARAYPDINPNRESAPTMEKGSNPGKRQQSGSAKLTYTKQELSYRTSFPSWTDKQFDQAVRGLRGES